MLFRNLISNTNYSNSIRSFNAFVRTHTHIYIYIYHNVFDVLMLSGCFWFGNVAMSTICG